MWCTQAQEYRSTTQGMWQWTTAHWCSLGLSNICICIAGEDARRLPWRRQFVYLRGWTQTVIQLVTALVVFSSTGVNLTGNVIENIPCTSNGLQLINFDVVQRGRQTTLLQHMAETVLLPLTSWLLSCQLTPQMQGILYISQCFTWQLQQQFCHVLQSGGITAC